MITLVKIPQVMRNVNSTGVYKDHTLIDFSIWIRNNEISDTQNQHTGFQNKQKDPGHKNQGGVYQTIKRYVIELSLFSCVQGNVLCMIEWLH